MPPLPRQREQQADVEHHRQGQDEQQDEPEHAQPNGAQKAFEDASGALHAGILLRIPPGA